MGSNIYGHGTIDYIVVISFCVFAFWSGSTKTNRILYILPAAATFWFFIDYVTLLTPIKLVPTIFLIANALRGGKSYLSEIYKSRWILAVLILLFVSFFTGLTYSFSFPDDLGYDPYKRLYIQTITNINYILIYIIIKKECNSNNLQIFIKAFLVTTTILCIYGVYQYFAYQLDLPVRGIVYSSTKAGMANDTNIGIFRINSLANEPKRLSYVLFLSVILLVSLKKIFNLSRIRYIAIILLHVVCAYLTYSTSLYLILISFFSILSLLSITDYRQRKHLVYVLYFFIGIIIYAIYNSDSLTKIIDARFTNQIELVSNKEHDHIDPHAYDLLLEMPLIAITGVGPGNYNFILKEYKGVGINASGLQVMDSALLNNIYDFGFMGLIVFFAPVYQILFKQDSYNNEITAKIAPITIIFLFCSCLVLLAWPLYFMFIAAFDGAKTK